MSDDRLRALVRRIAAGETDLIPAVARLWARTGGDARVIPPETLEEVVRGFRAIERDSEARGRNPDIVDLFARLRHGHVYPQGAIGYWIAFIRGVASALGMTIEQVWAESERARDGAGARARRRRELAVHYDGAVNFMRVAGASEEDASEAVSYMLEYQEEAQNATDARSLALAAAEWHAGVMLGNHSDGTATADQVALANEVVWRLRPVQSVPASQAIARCAVCDININDENGAPCGVCGDAFCLTHYGPLAEEECLRCRGGAP